LITLGLPESLTALVWVVAPLCGVIIQPYVGVLSDRCQIPWGRRKPFIVGGTIGSVVCMLGLACTKEIIHIMASVIHANIHSAAIRTLVLLSAIFWLLGLNLSIQPLQSGVRALIVDKCPPHQQSHASAWASRVTGIGNIVGYFFAFVPLRKILPFLHITQFSWLCVVASIALSAAVTVTCLFIKEQDPRSLPSPIIVGSSFWSTVIWSAKTMPRAIRQVCLVQFFAWLGWFPYLFYVSTYVGDLCKFHFFFNWLELTKTDAAPILARDEHMALSMQATVIEDAVRLGSLASLVFSVFALLTNIVIPSLIEGGSTTASPLKEPHDFASHNRMAKAWSYSQLLFASCMFSTIFITSQISATILVALVGISWAFTLWVPFAIIGSEVSARQERNAKVLEGELEPVQQDQAGAIMGLHNCAISAPQILAAVVSGCIFWLAPHLGSQDAIGWVLRFGGCGGLVASWLARRIEW
jgi:solute carrier family 45 protein 1/2/4